MSRRKTIKNVQKGKNLLCKTINVLSDHIVNFLKQEFNILKHIFILEGIKIKTENNS